MKKYFAREALLPQGLGARRPHLRRRGRHRRGRRAIPRRRNARRPGAAGHGEPAFARLPARDGRPHRDARSAPQDDFWTWRELMYRFVERVTPEQAQAIAHSALRRDAARTAIPRSRSSTTCTTPTACSWRISTPRANRASPSRCCRRCIAGRASAASHCNRAPATASRATSMQMLACASRACERARPPDMRVGVAPHSLRAVDPRALKELVAALPARRADPHPRRRADARSRGMHRRARQAAGGMAARQHARSTGAGAWCTPRT